MFLFTEKQGKPKPDIYSELVRRLNVDKNSCIVFEDSVSGVRAAVAAQIKCIGILTSAKRETLEQYGAWRTINNFEEVDLDEIWSRLEIKLKKYQKQDINDELNLIKTIIFIHSI